MSRCVPILGKDNILEFLAQCIDDWNDLIAVVDGQRATGQETVLYIDDQQDGICPGSHLRCGQRSRAQWKRHRGSSSALQKPASTHAGKPFCFVLVHVIVP